MTLFGNKDVAFSYLSNALGQTHDLTAFLTLNLKICFCVVSTYQLSVVVWIDACGTRLISMFLLALVGAALALRWEKEKQVQEKKITYRKSAWSKRKVK